MSTSTGARVTVQQVAKSFGPARVLGDVSFEAQPGSVTVLLGPSGQGKTTMLRLIAGFDRPDSGSIHLDDVEVAGARAFVPPERRGIGYVPQDAALFPHLDAARNVAYGLPRGSGGRVQEMLQLVGLADHARHRPAQLSGGQKQRVALARALAPSPRLVLLDEPFSALDASMRNDVRDDAIAILRAAGTTTILVTHDQDEAMALADHIVLLLDGRVAQAGSPAEIYDRPASAAVARFVGQANLLGGTVTDGRVTCALGSFPSDAPSGAVTVLVRPEHIVLVGEGDAGVDGVVERRNYYGHDGSLAVRTDSGDLITLRVDPARLAPVGERVRVAAREVASVFPPER